MKRFLLLLAVALFLPILAKAQTATTRIDTLVMPRYAGDAGKYVATWVLSAGTSVDTLQPPWNARYVVLINHSTTDGDTIQVAYSQSGSPRYTDILTIRESSIFTDFGSTFIKRIFVKANATVPMVVKLYN